jgi:hypothetical protein
MDNYYRIVMEDLEYMHTTARFARDYVSELLIPVALLQHASDPNFPVTIAELSNIIRTVVRSTRNLVGSVLTNIADLQLEMADNRQIHPDNGRAYRQDRERETLIGRIRHTLRIPSNAPLREEVRYLQEVNANIILRLGGPLDLHGSVWEL